MLLSTSPFFSVLDHVWPCKRTFLAPLQCHDHVTTSNSIWSGVQVFGTDDWVTKCFMEWAQGSNKSFLARNFTWLLLPFLVAARENILTGVSQVISSAKNRKQKCGALPCCGRAYWPETKSNFTYFPCTFIVPIQLSLTTLNRYVFKLWKPIEMVFFPMKKYFCTDIWYIL